MHQYRAYDDSDRSGTALKAIMGFVLLMFIFLAMGGRGCQVDDAQALRALKAAGYQDVKLVNRSNWFVGWSGCDSNDAVAWEAVATDPRGLSQVNVIVCAGWPFKGATVRVK